MRWEPLSQQAMCVGVHPHHTYAVAQHRDKLLSLRLLTLWSCRVGGQHVILLLSTQLEGLFQGRSLIYEVLTVTTSPRTFLTQKPELLHN